MRQVNGKMQGWGKYLYADGGVYEVSLHLIECWFEGRVQDLYWVRCLTHA